MEKGDIKYNEHFRRMVTDGLFCGLQHPVEWLVNYNRCTGVAYEECKEIKEFVLIAGIELLICEEGNYEQDIIPADVEHWIKQYYEK